MTKEALKLALEALEQYAEYEGETRAANEAITAIKKALANDALEKKAENARELGLNYEPVAFASHGVVNWIADKQFQHEADLYATPQRTWVGLTDEEIVLIVAECAASHQHTDIHFARAIEAKLKEKNT